METTVNNMESAGVGSLRLRMVARMLFGATLAALVLLVVAMLFFADENGMDYTQLIQSHSLTRQNLGTALVIAGLFLTVCVGALSWLLALYGSFRVAGPLFRFTRNLEQASGQRTLPGVRKGDCFQDVSRQLQQSVEALHRHHDEVRRLLDQAEAQFKSDCRDEEHLEETLAQLREVGGRVRID